MFRIIPGGKSDPQLDQLLEREEYLLSQWHQFSRLSENQRKRLLKGQEMVPEFLNEITCLVGDFYERYGRL